MQSVHQFAEKVALITDGANPVGRAVAMQLALQGSYVISVFENASKHSHDVEQMRALGTLAGSAEADVATPEGAASAVEEVGRSFGRLDLLVNCLKGAPDSAFKKDAEAARLVTEAARPLMESRPKPKIVNVGWGESSELEIFTSVEAEALPAKFRMNCVIVRGHEPQSNELEFGLLRPASVVPPDDVARVVTFLLSSESIALNGQVLYAGKPQVIGL